MQSDDWQLLDDYARRNSDEAFRALVDRHSGLVYHAALRQLGNPHAAQEVTQAVFTALAQKAGKIQRGAVLSGWLFRAARYAVSNLAREEVRRQLREQEVATMDTTLRSEETESAWEQISPHLNDALDKLPDRDREAVLIRFFQEKSHREVAGALGISEDAAKMRVSRAVEKLRLMFARQGFVVPTAVLFATLAAHAAPVAPAGLSAAVAAGAAAKGTSGVASTLTLAKQILKLMALSKTKTVVITGVVLLLAGVTTTVVLQQTMSKPLPPKAGPEKAGGVTVDRSTPKASLLAISRTIDTGDARLFLDGFIFVSPDEDEDAVKDTLERLITVIGEYRRTAIERFGAESATASFPSLPFKLPVEKLQAAKETINGDTAEVLFDTRERPIVLTRRAGQWKTTPGDLFHLRTEALLQIGTMQIGAYERAIARMRAGDYSTAMDAANAVHGGKK